MIDRRQEKQKSDSSHTLKIIKKRESEEVEPKNLPQNSDQFNSDQFNSNHLQFKHSLIISDKSSILGLQNPLLSQGSISGQDNRSKRYSQDELQNILEFEQPIPLIQLIEHQIRLRCRPELLKQSKCQGDQSEQNIVNQNAIIDTDIDQDTVIILFKLI